MLSLQETGFPYDLPRQARFPRHHGYLRSLEHSGLPEFKKPRWEADHLLHRSYSSPSHQRLSLFNFSPSAWFSVLEQCFLYKLSSEDNLESPQREMLNVSEKKERSRPESDVISRLVVTEREMNCLFFLCLSHGHA